MELKTSSHSHYPRIGEIEQQAGLRKAYHLFDRKKIDLKVLQKIQKETVQAILREQEAADLDVVTDGMILWHDPASHLMKNLEGVRVNGLLRFFDTNFYFRQPVITGMLKRSASSIKDEAVFLAKEAKTETKAVLTGPYTLALLAKIETDLYQGVKDMADALVAILAEEVKELAQAGIDYIQIEEPGFLAKEPDWAWAREALRRLSAGKGTAKIGLVTYFGDAGPVYSKLQTLPVDFLGVDCTYGAGLIDRIKQEGSRKDLLLGLLDGRNTRLENPKEIAVTLHALDRALSGRTVYVTTSCGLEYLPRGRAFDKLKLLKAVKREYETH